VGKALCLVFKARHDMAQTHFASVVLVVFPPSVVRANGTNSLCFALLTPLPCLMLFLLNVMFLSLLCNDFGHPDKSCPR